MFLFQHFGGFNYDNITRDDLVVYVYIVSWLKESLLCLMILIAGSVSKDFLSQDTIVNSIWYKE